MIKVIFVCLGNICRSPLAEAIFLHKVKQKGLDKQIEVDSAGTAAYHVGELADPRSIQVAEKNGISILSRGRKFEYEDGKNFDFILAMDASNKRNIIHELGYQHEGLYLMRDFDSTAKGQDVPDPYYGGDQGFHEVYNMLDRSTSALLDFIVEKHNL